jgi:hypothetical protein
MECTLCKCMIVTNNTTAPPGIQYGVQKTDDKWYCTGCSDVADFAIEVNTVTEKKHVAPKETKTEQLAAPKATSVILFYCSTCKITATGIKCEKCGTMNPMCVRRKKGQQKKK